MKLALSSSAFHNFPNEMIIKTVIDRKLPPQDISPPAYSETATSYIYPISLSSIPPHPTKTSVIFPLHLPPRVPAQDGTQNAPTQEPLTYFMIFLFLYGPYIISGASSKASCTNSAKCLAILSLNGKVRRGSGTNQRIVFTVELLRALNAYRRCQMPLDCDPLFCYLNILAHIALLYRKKMVSNFTFFSLSPFT